LRAKAAVSSYVTLGICLGMPAILSIMVIVVRPELFWEWLPMLAFGVVAVALTFLWLRTFRLQVSGGTLVYRTLFSGESRILLSDIVAVRRVLELNPWKHWMKPRHRLEVYTATTHGTTPLLNINLKVFTRRDIQHLFNLLDRKIQVQSKVTQGG
jgi:hypothetical protein